MITARLATPEDTDDIFGIIDQYTSIYGIDTVSSGWRAYHKKLIVNSFNIDLWNTIVAVNEQNEIIGFSLQVLFKTYTRWLLKAIYISKKETANSPFNNVIISAPMIDKMIELAEKHGNYEFYFVARTNRKTYEAGLSYSKALGEKYEISTYLEIPPFTPVTDPKISKMIGIANGKNSKTIFIRHGHLKGAYKYEPMIQQPPLVPTVDPTKTNS